MSYGTAISWERSRQMSERTARDEAWCGPMPSLLTDPRARYDAWRDCVQAKEAAIFAQEIQAPLAPRAPAGSSLPTVTKPKEGGIPGWAWAVAGAAVAILLVRR